MQSLKQQGRTKEELVAKLPAIEKFNKMGDEVRELSMEKILLKNDIVEQNQRWLKETKANQSKQTENRKKAISPFSLEKVAKTHFANW